MRYLGIDFGLKHLGLAIADGFLAAPYGEKINNERAISFLHNLVKVESIDKIVIGMPEGALAIQVKNFGKKLASLTGIEVNYQDETLSTQEAHQKLIAANVSQKKRRLDHQAAATLILQEFIDIMH